MKKRTLPKNKKRGRFYFFKKIEPSPFFKKLGVPFLSLFEMKMIIIGVRIFKTGEEQND